MSNTRRSWRDPKVAQSPILRGAITGALYFLAASLSLPLAVPGGIISPLWPPAALALFLCLRWGARMTAAIWLGAWLAFLWRGWEPLPAAIIGAASALAAWSATALIAQLQEKEGDFIYNGNLFRFIAIALLSGVISAPLALGGATLGARLGPDPLLGWLTWGLGTATGTVIFTPLLRAWRLSRGIKWTRAKKLEGVAFLALLPTVTHIAFSSRLGTWPLAYLPIPFVIWSAYRFNVPAVAWSTAGVCLIATANTLRGAGPLAHADLNTALLLLVVYVSAIGMIGLTLSSLIHQRGVAESKLKNERNNLEQRVLARTEALSAELRERRLVEQKLEEAQRLAQIGSWNWDLERNEIGWSDQMYRICKVDSASFALTPQNCLQLVHPDDRSTVARAFERCRRNGEPFSIEHRIRRPDGTDRIVSAHGQAARDHSGRVTRMFGTEQDITETRLAEAALREAQERYRLVVELSPDAILVQQDRSIVFANPAALHLLGASQPQQVLGKSLLDFLRPAEPATSDEHLARLTEGYSMSAIEKKLARLDGSEVDVEFSFSSFLHQARFAVLYIMRDITERKRSAEQMAYLAHFDSLTGLPNRALLYQLFEHALSIAARPGRSVEVLFLDLDHFKQINDTLGHATGDLVLKETAKRLQAILRESDTVARLAGDEFVVLVENVDEPQRAGPIAEKILAAFAPPFFADSVPLQISTSIGIAAFPNDGADAATLLKRADMAMYRAKQHGRNKYFYYSPKLNAQTAERRSLEQALRHALEREELSLSYQPRIDIVSGRVTGMEALLRWNHPQLGEVAPRNFIPLADKSGLILPIGYWALRQACSQARQWQMVGAADLKVAVNLSARQLADPRLVDNIGAILDDSRLDAHLLEVEIREDALMAEAGKVLHVLNALRTKGVGVTIDDFGIGYSSLARLKQLPIGAVKIDRSFVHGLPSDQGNAAITRAIIALAHNLGCSVVAQGAETRQEYDFLREHACDSVQGFYFSEARPAAHFGDLSKVQSMLHLH